MGCPSPVSPAAVSPRRFPWLTLSLVAVAAVLAALPATLLEYDRAAVAGGEIWRLATGQLVHWTLRMALFDLGAILLLGLLLELGEERRGLALALGIALPLCAFAVHVIQPHLDRYRGSSGLAAAVFGLVVMLGVSEQGWLPRLLVLAALAAFALKLIFEVEISGLVFGGDLPAGVDAAPIVHLAGFVAGVAAFLLVYALKRRA